MQCTAPSPHAQPCLESQSLIPIKTKFEEIIVIEREIIPHCLIAVVKIQT